MEYTRIETPSVPSPHGQGKVRGAFVNTAEANCSIFESGRMVFECLKDSALYDLDYFSIDTMDVDLFNQTSLLKRKGEADGGQSGTAYDFYVFNWHFITMASDIDANAIRRIAAPKFSVVLELAPGDPLMLVPAGVFDGYIALDPSIQDMGPIFAFPRPLEMEPRKGRPVSGDVPVIGSFGFGTPAKGFELLVEAVNREFDRAKVRINIPHGKYVETDIIHAMPYAKRLEEVCRKIAKPGIDVSFSSEFLTPEGLVEWCAQNDLNCFMYTRALPGLSATTDQCIISGQPLLTLTNDTFRHIHRYIEPYPYQGLRQAIATSGAHVRDIQNDWSKDKFRDLFHRMLGTSGIIPMPDVPPLRQNHDGQGSTILVVSRGGETPDNLTDHGQKIANALGRSRTRQIRHVSYEAAAAALAALEGAVPAGVILVDYDLTRREPAGAAFADLPCPKIVIPSSDGVSIADYPYAWSNTVVVPRLPVIPFHTTSTGLKTPRSVILLGFSRNAPLLEETLKKIFAENAAIEVIVEAPNGAPPPGGVGVAPNDGQSIAYAPFSLGDPNLPHRFGESSLVIAYNDTARTGELEALFSVALVTERPVVFTRKGVFPSLLGRERYMEDDPTPDLIQMGVAAHIRVFYDFGEWTFATGLRRVLDGSWRAAVAAPADAAVSLIDPEAFLRIAVMGTRAQPAGGASRPPATARPDLLSRGVSWVRARLNLQADPPADGSSPLFEEADHLRDQKLWGQAAQKYRAGLELAPKAFDMWIQCGNVAKEAGDFDLAETAYARALSLNPREPDLHLQLGHFYNVRNDPARARIYYAGAYALGSRDPHALPQVQALVAQIVPAQMPEPAPSHAPLPDDEPAAAHFARGDHLRDAGAWRAAADCYAAGLRTEPGAVQYWAQLGNMLKEAEAFGEAEQAYLAALQLAPAELDLHLQMGHLLSKVGRIDEAATHYVSAVSLGSRDPHALAVLSGRTEQNAVIRNIVRQVSGGTDAHAAEGHALTFSREILRAVASAH